jgi:magnesium-transporting ATPase (P-type)
MNNKRTSLIVSSIVIILIAFTPYLLYVYKSFPSDKKVYETFFGVINSGYFNSVQLYMYSLVIKFVPLLLLLIWFATNKHWWVHVLVIPISVYLFQLISVLNDGAGNIDQFEFIYTIPFLIVVMFILYAIRYKLSIYVKAVDLKKEMDKKMDDAIEKRKKRNS